MMEIKEIRVMNLIAFVRQEGGAAKVARKFPEIDASYISQLVNKHRPFGEKSARRIEALCNLPNLYFDTNQNEVTQFDIKDFSRLTDKLNAPQRAQLEELLSYFVVLNDNNKKLVLDLTRNFYESDTKLNSIARMRAPPAGLLEGNDNGRRTERKKA